jgi:hypothetical protein
MDDIMKPVYTVGAVVGAFLAFAGWPLLLIAVAWLGYKFIKNPVAVKAKYNKWFKRSTVAKEEVITATKEVVKDVVDLSAARPEGRTLSKLDVADIAAEMHRITPKEVVADEVPPHPVHTD